MSGFADNILSQCARAPSATAVHDDNTSHTFHDLEEASRSIAQSLVAAGISHGARVCISLPKSFAAVAAIMGIARAGASFVPLDHTAPAAYQAAQVVGIDVAAAIIAPTVHEAAERLFAGFSAIQAGGFAAKQVRILARAAASSADQEAYVIFTSGSTGRPKAVAITIQALQAYLAGARTAYGLAPGDRVFGPAPLHFDFSIQDIVYPLSVGAGVLCAPATVFMPGDIIAWLRRTRVTTLSGVPSFFLHIAQGAAVEANWFPDLDRVIFGGEHFPVAALRAWMASYPNTTFINTYGPTEATVFVTAHRLRTIPELSERVPIGEPLGDTVLQIATEDAPAPGELLISGSQLARGYVNDAQLTRDRFVVDRTGARWYRTGDLAARENGEIFVLGRLDTQIKLYGRRVELGAIEDALMQVRGVREAVAVARKEADGRVTGIICHVASDRSETEIKHEMAQRVPHHMVPARVVFHASVPRTSNGKMDRAACAAAGG
ncbi:MAG: amino acid adenylation domain-containing protein [Rhizomicrobium sp.]